MKLLAEGKPHPNLVVNQEPRIVSKIVLAYVTLVNRPHMALGFHQVHGVFDIGMHVVGVPGVN